MHWGIMQCTARDDVDGNNNDTLSMRRNLIQEAKEDKKPNNSYSRMSDDDKGPGGV